MSKKVVPLLLLVVSAALTACDMSPTSMPPVPTPAPPTAVTSTPAFNRESWSESSFIEGTEWHLTGDNGEQLVIMMVYSEPLMAGEKRWDVIANDRTICTYYTTGPQHHGVIRYGGFDNRYDCYFDFGVNYLMVKVYGDWISNVLSVNPLSRTPSS